ncbi:hypothetical protein AB0I76_20950, partial [Micromonospora sp. NPDC049799]
LIALPKPTFGSEMTGYPKDFATSTLSSVEELSRASTGSAGYGVAVLAVGGVGAVVLGLRDSAAPWLVPPVMATARAAAGDLSGATVALLTAWTVAWCGVAGAAYLWHRRFRP